MGEPKELQFKVTNKKKVEKYSGQTVTDTVYKFTLEATNVDEDVSMKIKAPYDLAQEEDTFSFRDLVTQKGLEEVIDDLDDEEDDE